MKYQDHQLLEEAYDKVLLKEGRDADHDTDDSFGERVETEFSLDGVDFFAAANLYGSTVYVDDSFDHAFGTKEGHHFEKKVEGIENLEIHYYKGDKDFPLTPETFGLEKYKELRKMAEENLTEKVESE